jgi:3-dehydroquinate synthase
MKDTETVDMSRLTVKTGKSTSYDIVYKTSFEALTAEVGELYPDKPAICVITDTNVDPLYSE